MAASSMTPIDKAAAACGGPTGLAKALSVSVSSVCNWRVRGTPAERCPDIERATGGAVRCEDLRPDVAWGVLRGAA